ncbi:putative DNA condensation protein [Erwinia phage pEa_SNUABM_47]|uniref:Putative DNA condensation protein n=1 Tax=Erwinia phage pEa_SNUABM_47 TaxID=2768774 RepID=A0A7L8ZQ07_9CAUD|nr:putative DNA condensation protein [Erwinia phage pEa_SNUABM_47]
MLPFPIMNKYGNTVVKNKIKKVLGSGRVVALLYDNGNLYMRGSNQYTNFGIASPSDYKNWVLVRTNVKEVWLNNYHTIIQTYDDQFLCAGYGRALGYGGTSYLWTVYDRLYTLTSTPATTVKQICLNIYGTFVLLNTNNNLYALGFNAYNCLGVGALNSTSTAFTLTRSSVKYVHSNLAGTFCIGTNNVLYARGLAQNYKMGNNSNTDMASWTTITLPAGYTYPVMAFEGYIHTLIYAASDSTLNDTAILYCGYTSTNPGGAIPPYGSNYTPTFRVGAGGTGNSFSSFGTGYLEIGHQSFYTDAGSTNLYSAGSAGPSLGSSTNKSTGFTIMPLPSTGITSFCSAGNADTTGVTFVVQNNILYACGNVTWLDATTYNFLPQEVPE